MSKRGFHVLIFWLAIQIVCVVQGLAQIQTQEIYIDSQRVEKKPLLAMSANQHLLNLWKQGYLFAQVHETTDSSLFIYKGEKSDFQIRSINDSLIKAEQRPFYLAEKRLHYFNNHGYPFSELNFSDPIQDESGVSVNLVINSGPYVEFDSIVFSNKIKTNTTFIERTLEIERGAPYSEAAYLKIDQRMARMPYLEQKGDKDISFQNGKSTIYLQLNEQSANTFEGVLSLLPNPSSSNLLFTGFVNLHMDNLFYSGKTLSFEWNRFDARSQSLDLSYRHPFLAGTRLLTGVDFSLRKQDTSFISRNFDLSIGTYFANRGVINFTYKRATGTLIDADSSSWSNIQALDYERTLYGVNLNYDQYDEPMSYGNQLKFFSSLAFGEKRVNKNAKLESEIYDSLKQKSAVLMLDFKWKSQRILVKRTVLYNQVEIGGIFNDRVFSNEVYRLGGLRTIRGFNEQAIYSSQYLLSRLEVRQYFESRSHFMIFYDQLFTRYAQSQDWPFGLGVGFSLSSNRSLFNFAMAVGKSKNYPLDLANIKIHFGYISKF